MKPTDVVGFAIIGTAVLIVLGVSLNNARIEAKMPRNSFVVRQSRVVTVLLGFVATWPVVLAALLFRAPHPTAMVYQVIAICLAIAVVLFTLFLWLAMWQVRVDGDLITVRRLFLGSLRPARSANSAMGHSSPLTSPNPCPTIVKYD